MPKLKTKILTIEVETDLPNKAFTKEAMQWAMSYWASPAECTVKQVRVQQAQAPKAK